MDDWIMAPSSHQSRIARENAATPETDYRELSMSSPNIRSIGQPENLRSEGPWCLYVPAISKMLPSRLHTKLRQAALGRCGGCVQDSARARNILTVKSA
jgi:hypothetical protein